MAAIILSRKLFARKNSSVVATMKVADVEKAKPKAQVRRGLFLTALLRSLSCSM